MYLPRALVVGAVALAIVSSAAPTYPRPPLDRAPVQSRCGRPGSATFPIAARLKGGPVTYERGGDQQVWELELRNGTGADCRDVHPVAVFADRGRALRPGDIRFDFYDTAASRWRPVRLERTDEAENVGVFEGTSPDFPGFAVPAHAAVPVRVRLGFTGGAPEGPVTFNVTAVQRRGGDGDWVGESDDYTFGVAGTAASAAPGAGRADDEAPGEGEATEAGHRSLLADTGSQRPLFAIGAAAFALVLAGGSMIFGARRARR
ncbi:hypothetical protein [Streptomyces sp. NPDC051173]|uniref:hypothetical protein n=1 Tax=Streptomyces sp. NPDC051173 TaxID=3155164 RepID=UPI00344E4D7E